MAMWNPWRGCHRYSEGCRFCYIHKGDAKRGVDTDRIVPTENLDAPVARMKNGEYKMKPGQLGTHFVKDGKEYTIQKKDLCAQARKTNINYEP